MRSNVMSNRISLLLKVSSVGVLGGLIAGCSSGFQRFDSSIYESAIPQQTAQVGNPYPAGVDPTTTASVGKRLTPYSEVAPKAVPQGVYHNAEPRYAAPAQPAYGQQTYQQPAIQQPAYQPPQAYKPLDTYSAQQPQTPPASSWSTGGIKSSSLPKAKAYEAPKVISYAQPATSTQDVYIPPVKTDPVKTSSIPAATKPVVSGEDGWTSTGGTTISVREGETLYNLSKRYGVPVSAIKKANGISGTAGLQSGQRVVIPNYVFSPTSPISAPDNNPGTRAARASTGYLGEPTVANVAIPTQRPYQVAAISPSGQTDDMPAQRYKPKTHVTPPTKEPAPDYSIVTGSVSSSQSTYTVQSGDSLSRIASRNGTTIAALQNANSLSTSSIRIGQKLVIPGSAGAAKKVQTTQTASLGPVKPKIAPTVTKSTNTQTASIAEVDSKTSAPERTGISEFRWPVKGRVVSEFGDRRSDGKNDGIDISVPEGTAVRSAENGVVIYAGTEISSYGKLVLVRHTGGWVSAYAHNRAFEVEKGDNVRRGQIIARSGKTGDTSRPKLHFELRKDSNPVDPKKHLTGA